jgi:tellurite resistance protein
VTEITELTLPPVEPARLFEAVSGALETRADGGVGLLAWHLPSPDRLRAGATEALADNPEHPEAAAAFQGLLEVGYLVASADGLADAERHALAELLERVTGRVADRKLMEQHFVDLDAACAMLGRRERLRRAAAEFEDAGSRREALAFAALVSLMDGAIAEPEREALLVLGEHFELSEDDIVAVIGGVFKAVERALRAPGGGR